MFCVKCGQQLPDDAKFCFKCGTPTPGGANAAGAPAPTARAAPAASMAAAGGVQEFKCPSCGAPLKPVFGETVITCDYCGSSVSLGGSGWNEISKHTMLVPRLTDPDAMLGIVRAFMDTGFFNRKKFEESKVVDHKLSMIPYWILPVSASTNYQYTDVAVGVGSTVATMALSAAIGGAVNREMGGGGMFIPMMAGPSVNPTRQDSITGEYEYPVLAVRALSNYQPKDYAFALTERTFFDRKGVPSGAPILNGDLTEEAAKNAAKAYVTQLQSEQAHKRHRMVSHFQSDVQVSEGELLHAPIWQVTIEHKGGTVVFLVDAHSGRVMNAPA